MEGATLGVGVLVPVVLGQGSFFPGSVASRGHFGWIMCCWPQAYHKEEESPSGSGEEEGLSLPAESENLELTGGGGGRWKEAAHDGHRREVEKGIMEEASGQLAGGLGVGMPWKWRCRTRSPHPPYGGEGLMGRRGLGRGGWRNFLLVGVVGWASGPESEGARRWAGAPR